MALDAAVRGRDPLAAVAWPVRSARLLLRRASLEDAETTWEFRRLPEFARWMTRAPTSFAEYRSQFTDAGSLAKTLVIDVDDAVVGDLMLDVHDAWAQAEIAHQARGVEAELGWGLHPDHARRGYATEAVTEVLRICFDELGLRRVTAQCFADNVASWRLMERLGMRCECRTLQDSLHRSGMWMDGFGYALLATEWRARRASERGIEFRPD